MRRFAAMTMGGSWLMSPASWRVAIKCGAGMDSFEWNKIIGASLGTILFVVAVHIGSQAVYNVPPPAKPGYVVPGVQAKAEAPAAAAAPVAEAPPDFATAIPAADAMAGAMIAERCGARHDLAK